MKHAFALIRGALVLVLLAGCGPSPEEIAAMTASAWTPTPVPPTQTPVPTPIPIDLTIAITDETGAPVAGANIVFPESGKGDPVQSDEQGKFSWTNLASETATFKVSAQGYSSEDQTTTLQRGVNEVSITLKQAPFGLTPSGACAPGETFLYAEDFQDLKVEGWGTYPPGTAVLIESDPNEPENQVLPLNFGETDGEFQVKAIPLQDNVVRRLKYKPGDHSRFNVGFGKGDPGYFIVLSADEFTLNYYTEATGRQTLATGKPVMERGVWHLLEFSSYNGRIEAWVDGVLAAANDGTPLMEGNIIGVGSAFLPPESIVRIDDISLCGLNAPFTSMYIPAQ